MVFVPPHRTDNWTSGSCCQGSRHGPQGDVPPNVEKCASRENVVLRLLEKVIDDGSHRSGGDSVVFVPPIEQIVGERFLLPGNAVRRDRNERRGFPSLRFAAGKAAAQLFGAKRIARGMASAAVPETLHEVGAPVPFVVPGIVGDIGAAVEEQQVPTGNQDPDVERKPEFVFWRRRRYRLARHDERVNGSDILHSDLSKMIVREGGVKIVALAIDAFVHGPHKGFFGPRPDAGLSVGCDVRGVEGSERRRQLQAAREEVAAWASVAHIAVAKPGERLPPFDQFGGENRALGRLDRRDLCIAVRPAEGRHGKRGTNDHDRHEDSRDAHMLPLPPPVAIPNTTQPLHASS